MKTVLILVLILATLQVALAHPHHDCHRHSDGTTHCR